MKCSDCNGTGKSKYGYNQPCTHCYGKGFVEPLTNEEYIRSTTTEELAEWLWKHFDNGEVIVLWEKYGRPMYKDDNGISRADYTEAMKKWLKEIHANFARPGKWFRVTFKLFQGR